MANEIYALHLEGKLLQPDGRRPPKKLYYKKGHAKIAIRHLPEQIRDKVEIIKYIPEEE